MILNEKELQLLQQKEAEMFKVFISVCEKLGVRYYAVAGTLLGTVRHKGFIPWDDDIDVGVPRKDYERLKQDAASLLPMPYFLQSYESDPETPFCFMKLRDSSTAFIETKMKSLNMNHGIWLDIFPLDFLPPNKLERKTIQIQEKLVDQVIGRRMSLDKQNGWGVRAIVKSIIVNLLCIRFQSMQKATEYKDHIHIHNREESYCLNYSGVYGQREIMPLDWYGDGLKMPFMDFEIRVPVKYDKVLTQLYGDYMKLPPVEQRVNQHEVAVFDLDHSYLDYV